VNIHISIPIYYTAESSASFTWFYLSFSRHLSHFHWKAMIFNSTTT